MTLRQQGMSTLAYSVLGLFGIALAFPAGYASPVYPAAGLALALVLYFGNGVLPGIWLGALTVNVLVAWHHGNFHGTGIPTVAILATGATLQAWVGRVLVLSRLGENWRQLESERDIVQLLAFGGLFACLVSATVGVATLYFAGLVNSAEIAFSWWSWWLGDTLGVLIFTPLTLSVLLRAKHPWQDRLRTVALPMLVMLLLVTGAFFGAARWEQERQFQQIRDYGEDLAQLLVARFVAHQEALSALRRLIEVMPNMHFRQFEYFTQITLKDNKDMFALSFNPYVTHNERPAFEMSMAQRSTFSDYTITERDSQRQLTVARERPDYVPVGFIAPLEGNLPAIGFDIHSEPVRRDAISHAMQSRHPAVTAPIQLVQDHQPRIGVLVLHPAYQYSDEGDIPLEHSKLVGFSVGVIKVDQMVEIATADKLPEGLIFHLDDTDAPENRRLLYRSSTTSAPAGTPFLWRKPLIMADRIWEMKVFPTAEFLRQHRPWSSWIVGVVGLMLATLLQVLMLVTTGRTAVVQRKVDEQTHEIKAKNDDLQSLLNEHEQLIQRIPVGIYKLHMTVVGAYHFDYVSPLWCEQIGVTASEVASDPSCAFHHLHPEDRASFFDSYAEARRAERPHSWQGRIIKAGEMRWLQINSMPRIQDNGDVVWDGVQLDISERKTSEEQQRLLSTAVSQSNSAVVITDSRGDIVFVNDAVVKIAGYSREELLGRNPRLFQSGLTDAEVYRSLWQTILRRQTWHGEIQNRNKAGELYWELTTISPVTDETGNITHYIAIKDNITARKRQEVELKKAKEEAEAANVAKSRFLATMSHEIRTPMNGILGMAQILLMPSLSEAERQDYVRTILNSGKTLLTLLNDILDLSKVEANKVELESTAFNPGQVIQEIRTLFAETATSQGLKLEANWPGSAQRYLGDPLRLRQMLNNLVNNAIKFTAEGAICINAAEIDRDAQNATLEFSVSDTGIGIPEEKLSVLFQPFSQVDNTTMRKYGGTGLGLSIVRSLAHLMSGTVGVESHPGYGSKFWFRIRVGLVADYMDSRKTQRAGNAAQNNQASSSTPLSGHILVVDDISINRKVIGTMLTRLGLTYVEAEDGQQGVDAVTRSQTTLDLILMDIQMPLLDGYAASRQIRQWEAETGRQRLPIIALTADAYEEDRKNCLAAGMDDFLTKPVDFNAVPAILAKWLNRRIDPDSPPHSDGQG